MYRRLNLARVASLTLISSMIFISGCSVNLTKAGRNIVIVNSASSELVHDCKKLGHVTGYSKSGWGNSVGLSQAYADARNKAGAFPEADTMAVTNKIKGFTGGEVTAFVYNCNLPIKSSMIPETTSSEINKTKKCQEAGGKLTGDLCILSLN